MGCILRRKRYSGRHSLRLIHGCRCIFFAYEDRRSFGSRNRNRCGSFRRTQWRSAWNDYHDNVIAFSRSFTGGASWDVQRTVAPKNAAFDVGIPAESFRRALVYPACDADRSNGPGTIVLFVDGPDASRGHGHFCVIFG